jgi:hypothetical protein
VNLVGIVLATTYFSVFIGALALMPFGSMGFAGFAVWVVVDAFGIVLIGFYSRHYAPSSHLASRDARRSRDTQN